MQNVSGETQMIILGRAPVCLTKARGNQQQQCKNSHSPTSNSTSCAACATGPGCFAIFLNGYFCVVVLVCENESGQRWKKLQILNLAGNKPDRGLVSW